MKENEFRILQIMKIAFSCENIESGESDQEENLKLKFQFMNWEYFDAINTP